MTQRQFRDRAQIIRGRSAARGISRQVDHHGAGTRADQGGKSLGIHGARCIERIADGNCPGESHDRWIDRKARVGHEHLVAGFEDGEQGIEQHRLGTRDNDDMLRRCSHAAPRQ